MKTLVSSLSAILCGAILVTVDKTQAQQDSPQSERPAGPPPIVRELPDRYAILAAADVNRDRQLDVDELATLATALSDGTIERPAGLPKVPEGVAIPYQMIALKLGELYQSLAPYDIDLNGKLEEEEREAIRKAIFVGELKPPFLVFRGERPSREGRGFERRAARPSFRGRR